MKHVTIFVRQPNGRYAHFSSETNDFTLMGMTRRQALALARKEVGDQNQFKVHNADADKIAWNSDSMAPEGRRRWEGCLATIRQAHGLSVLLQRQRSGGQTVIEDSASTEPVKVTLGYIVKNGVRLAMSPYFGVVALTPEGITTRWRTDQRQALRLSKVLAREVAQRESAKDEVCHVRVVRLVKTVRGGS